MIQLQQSDVDALRCAFVNDIYRYTKCRKYAIDCCLTEAKESFLDYKLSESTCTLDDKTICSLVNKVEPTLLVSCQSEVPCEVQASIKILSSSSGHIYTPTLLTDYTTPAYDAPAVSLNIPMFLLETDSIYQTAGVITGIVDEDYNIIFPASSAATGQAKVGMSTVVSNDYALKAFSQFALDGYNNIPNGYISKVRIYYTNSIGQYVPGQFWDINTHPNTTPYRTCGTCTLVNIADLFFGDADWATSFKTLVDNAVRDLTGGVNISFSSSKATSGNRAYLSTDIKHKPSATWAGLNTADLMVEVFNGAKFDILTQSSETTTTFSSTGNLYGTHTFTLPCGSKIVEIPNTPVTIPLNTSTTKFNEIKLTSNATTSVAVIADPTSLDCQTITYSADIVSNEVITLVQWLNSVLTIVGTGYTFTPEEIGNYTLRVTLASGCIIDTIFGVDAIGMIPINLLTEDNNSILTENSNNIII